MAGDQPPPRRAGAGNRWRHRPSVLCRAHDSDAFLMRYLDKDGNGPHGVTFAAMPDIARFRPIWPDSSAKLHDTRTILYDSHSKTPDFDPKLNDIASIRCNICEENIRAAQYRRSPGLSCIFGRISCNFGRLSCRFVARSGAFARISRGIGQYRAKAGVPWKNRTLTGRRSLPAGLQMQLGLAGALPSLESGGRARSWFLK